MGKQDQSSLPQGLLYVEVKCPLELEGEFHAWYNQEHIPERLGIRGFVTGRRYAALEGEPRWLAVYALESVAVLESPEYLQWLGARQTVWTRRILANTQVVRSVFRLAVRRDSAESGQRRSGLLAVRYEASAAEEERVSLWHDTEFSSGVLGVPGVLSTARYENTEGPEHLVLYELEQPWIAQETAFTRLWTAGWESRKSFLSRYRRTLYIRIL